MSQATPITIGTVVKVNPEKAWEIWTGAEHITKWNSASDDWHTPHATNDVRTGGSFSFTMASKDGCNSFDFGGIYDHVEPGKSLSYTMQDGRKATVIFAPHPEGTEITETFDPENMHPAEFQKAGWQAILDNYRKYAEQQ